MNEQLFKLPDVFSSEDAIKAGISPVQLAKMVDLKQVEKIRRGIYRKHNVDDHGYWSSYQIACKKVRHRSAVCLISALEYHHLSESIPSDIWLLVDAETRSSKDGIHLFRRRDPK